MPSETVIRKVRADIFSPMGEGSAASIQIKASVGAYTLAHFTSYSGSEAGTSDKPINRVVGPEIMAALGAAQAVGYSDRASVDTNIYLEDGNEGSLSFYAFLTGPGYMLQPGSLMPAVTATGEGSIIEHLRLDIYNPTPQSPAGVLEIGNKAAPGEDIEDPNLAIRLRKVTEKVIDLWEKAEASQREESKLDAVLAANRDRINRRGPLDAWYELLDNSVPYLTIDWLGDLKGNKAFNSEFNEMLLLYLRQPQKGFSQVLGSLMQAFQLIWVPGHEGGVGSLRKVDVVTTSQTRPLVLSTVTFTQSAQPSGGLFPTRQVIMKGVPYSVHFTKNSKSGKGGKSSSAGEKALGSWPKGDNTPDGDVLIIRPPAFLNKVLDYSASNGPSRTAPEDFDAMTESLDYTTKLTQQYVDKVIQKAVEGICRSAYRDATLRASQLTVSVPLDLTLRIGERYAVRDSRGGELFVGFLSSLTHAVKKSGPNGEATSSLQFSHVLYPGFTLPNNDS